MSAKPALDLLASAPTHSPREPDWLARLRAEAADYIAANGLPTPRHENWKYTNLRALQRRQFEPGEVPALNAADVPQLEESGLPAATFVNGRLYERQSLAGVSVRTLAEVLAQDPEAYADRLGALVDTGYHPLAALNTACFADCIVIRMEAGAKAEMPLLLEYVSAPAPDAMLCCPRVLLDLQDNSSLTVVERFAGLEGAENYTNALTEAFLSPGARLDHYRLQELGDAEFVTGLLRVNQQRDSRLTARSVDLGGKLARHDLHTTLAGAGATTRLTGFYLAVGRQHIDNHTRIDHDAPHTSSHEVFHGVLGDRARAVFNGKVIVARDAQKVDAHQSNRNLLLSGSAEIDTKPELEIYADDVRCSHGATIGQLDDNALFYLRSRGLDEPTARALLTFAFADEVLREWELSELREYIERIVAHRLPDHDRLESLV